MEAIRRGKQYDIARDITWYDLTERDVVMLNERRRELGLQRLEFVAPDAEVPEQRQQFHYEPGDCPRCAATGPHLVEQEPS